MQARSPLLDRATLERLERLTIHWKKSFRGLLGGSNPSRYAGVGYEFIDHRHFHPGDDLRAVNWRAYLRLEQLFLKMFQTEPRTPVWLWIDTSESMACGVSAGKPGEPKFSYACRLAAALSYIGLVRLETIVLQPFCASLGDVYRAQGGRHRFAVASEFLSGLSTGGCSNFVTAAREFLSRDPSPGLLIVLSDFLDDGSMPRALKHLADHGHELLLIHLAGWDDGAPQWQGEMDLVDAETGAVLRVNLDYSNLREYMATCANYRRQIEYAALRSGGRYLYLRTDKPLSEVLHGDLVTSGAMSRAG